jgi:glutathione S-transferase
MKLYYSPGACSLAPHIALQEIGVPYTTAKVDLLRHKLADGTDYYTINPKGYVPMLELPGGERLTEVAVILQRRWTRTRGPRNAACRKAVSPEAERYGCWRNGFKRPSRLTFRPRLSVSKQSGTPKRSVGGFVD